MWLCLNVITFPQVSFNVCICIYIGLKPSNDSNTKHQRYLLLHALWVQTNIQINFTKSYEEVCLNDKLKDLKYNAFIILFKVIKSYWLRVSNFTDKTPTTCTTSFHSQENKTHFYILLIS